MKRILLALVLVSSFLVSGIMAASAQEQSFTDNPCTTSNPCADQVCGDHICAPGEYDKMQQDLSAEQRNSDMQNTTTVPQTTGNVVGGVMAYKVTASDGTVVIIRTSHPISGQPLSLGIAFKNAANNFIQHQNYAITITQDNAIVLSNQNGHTHTGIDTQTTFALTSANPVDIKITLNGVGLPGTDPSTWTGVKGEAINFKQVERATTPQAPTDNATVPEFGPIASLVLVIAVVSVVAVTMKTRVFLKL